MKNKHLTSVQRNQIEVLLQTQTAIKKIAQLLDTDKSTIYREISRNKRKRSYSASYAQELCSERKERFGLVRTFTVGIFQIPDFIDNILLAIEDIHGNSIQ